MLVRHLHLIYVVTLRFFMFGFSVLSCDKTVVKVWIRLGTKTTWCQRLVNVSVLLPLTQLECVWILWWKYIVWSYKLSQHLFTNIQMLPLALLEKRPDVLLNVFSHKLSQLLIKKMRFCCHWDGSKVSQYPIFGPTLSRHLSKNV